METTAAEFFLALINIVFLDLILAGDNAIVIGLAARNLPKETQKKAIIYGTAGAVILRIIATILSRLAAQHPLASACGRRAPDRHCLQAVDRRQ